MIHRREELLFLQEAPLTIPGVVLRGTASPGSPSLLSTGNVVLDLILVQIQQYATTSDFNTLTRAIRELRSLSAGLSPGSYQLAEFQSGLCAALRQVYERTGEESALLEAVRAGEASIQAVHNPASFATRIVTHANALFAHFSHTGNIGSLHRAGALLDQLLPVVQGTPSYDLVATCLAECLRVRSLALNDTAALDRSLALLGSTSNQLSDIALVTYARCLQQRYYRSRNSNDLELGISMCEQALLTTEPVPVVRAALLQAATAMCALRAVQNGNRDELDTAVILAKQGLELVQDFATLTPGAKIQLGLMELHRYMNRGNVVDLPEVLTDLETALSSIPPNGLDRAPALYTLTLLSFYKYDAFGRTADLESMVGYARQCLPSTTPQRLRYHASLILLSNALWTRYNHLRQGRDLQDYVQLAQRAVDYMATGYTAMQATCLGNLGTAQRRAASATGDTELLDTAINNLHRSIELQGEQVTDGLELHAEYFELGEAYVARAKHANDPADWTNSIQAHRQGIQYIPQGHAGRTRALVTLGVVIREYFLATGHGDLQESTDILQEAGDATPVGVQIRARALIEYGRTSTLLYQQDQDADRLNEALNAYKTATRDESSFVRDRYEAATLWAEAAKEQGNLQDAVEASRQAMMLFPRLAWAGSNHNPQLREQTHNSLAFGAEAAAMAIELGAYEQAIELLEGSQHVFWTQIRGLRSDLQELTVVAPALAKELEELGRIMEGDGVEPFLYVEAAMDRRRRQTQRWEYLVREVRRLPGFERFLIPASFGLLRQAVRDIPVIVVNVSERRCDALVITNNHRIQHLPLPTLTLQLAEELYLSLARVSGPANDRPARTTRENTWLNVLDKLWQVFGQPLVNTLARLYPGGPPSRIRLCPVGVASLLPLHAAMPRGTQQRGFPDLFFCSYISSISTLRKQGLVEGQNGMQRLLATIDPSTPGMPPGAGSHVEKRVIQQLRLPTAPAFLEGQDATTAVVCNSLAHYDWIHVRTYAKTVSDSALDSCLYLHDGPLRLSRLSQLKLSHIKLAFLSTAFSAPGPNAVPGECLQLATALHFVGIESIVATMGPVGDSDGAEVAKHLYAYMTRDGQIPNQQDAAEGLRRAVSQLRRQNVPISRWAPFIHIG